MQVGAMLVDATLVDAMLVDATLEDAMLVDAMLVGAMLVDAMLADLQEEARRREEGEGRATALKTRTHQRSQWWEKTINNKWHLIQKQKRRQLGNIKLGCRDM